MDTVTESGLAIAMAQAGGIGVIHKNLEPEEQAAEVRKVKKFESGIVVDPFTIAADATLADALRIKDTYNISGIPVVDGNGGRLLGILTNRDVRFADNPEQPVSELMTRHTPDIPLITVSEDIDRDEAKRILHQHRIEKLLVVDADFHCVGLITVKDIERAHEFPNACKDEHGRLRVAAATGVGEAGRQRAEALLDAKADVIVVDTAHGHSDGVLSAVQAIKKLSNYVQVVAGNIATPDGAKALIDAGADCVKVGIGPGTICTTRMVAGVGMPQFSAVLEVAEACRDAGVPVIADGGVKYSGDVAKAIAAGANCVMIGSLFAGTDESPGEVLLYQGRSLQVLPGHGIDRRHGARLCRPLLPAGGLGQSETGARRSGGTGPLQRTPCQRAASVGRRLAGPPWATPATAPSTTCATTAPSVGSTGAGLRESHVHDVTITREAPNYRSTD